MTIYVLARERRKMTDDEKSSKEIRYLHCGRLPVEVLFL